MKQSEWIIHSSPDQFRESVWPFLEQSEAEHNVLLTRIDSLKHAPSEPRPFMAELRSKGETIALALHAHKSLMLSQCREDVWPELAIHLHEQIGDFSDLLGPADAASSFAVAWAKLRHCTSSLKMQQRLYQLIHLHAPAAIPGRLRVMEEHDLDLAIDWLHAFDVAAAPDDIRTIAELRASTQPRIASRFLFFWDLNGTPVAMAALARPSRRGIAVNTVYTPPEYRKNGYATALVAAVSAEGLSRGKDFCILYTDLANPTSNSIYQKVGYRPLADAAWYAFRY